MGRFPKPDVEFDWRARAYLVGINAKELELEQLRDARTVAKSELTGKTLQRVINELDTLIRGKKRGSNSV